MPVKAPHYHLMGGWARQADPATVQQALLRHSRPRRAILPSPRPISARPNGQAGEAR